MEINTKGADTMWSKIANKTYQHTSGVQVIYRHNTWNWEIVGGREDGNTYKTLRVAQHYAA
jgi:hypothetical protein